MKICVSSEIAEQFEQRITSLEPEAELVRIERDGHFSTNPDGVEVFFLSEDLVYKSETIEALVTILKAPSLRWLQSVAAGVDHPIFAEILARGVRLTTASGIHAEPIAQYVMAHMLFWEKRIAEHLNHQLAHEWARIIGGELTGKTLGVVGMGGIGQALARLAKPFDMRVIGTKRSLVENPNIDELLPPDRLQDLLAASHYVVLCLPLTDETRKLIGKEQLSVMRHDAVLINVARGEVVDEIALIGTLRERLIRGATLDVVAEEPLAKESPLWDLANCVITPHNAGLSPLGNARLTELFMDNLARYVRGDPLRNEVDDVGII